MHTSQRVYGVPPHACVFTIQAYNMASKKKRPRGRPAVWTALEKKILKKERDRANSGTKVYLGDQYVRWMTKKRELGETHAGLAEILLDRFVDINNVMSFLLSPGYNCSFF